MLVNWCMHYNLSALLVMHVLNYPDVDGYLIELQSDTHENIKKCTRTLKSAKIKLTQKIDLKYEKKKFFLNKKFTYSNFLNIPLWLSEDEYFSSKNYSKLTWRYNSPLTR